MGIDIVERYRAFPFALNVKRYNVAINRDFEFDLLIR
jgi:hypothetical protein